jgi:cyclohexyl-isocyanide hydratase
VRSDCGLSLVPTRTFANCPPLDLICIPGGVRGVVGAIGDRETVEFVRMRAGTAKYVTAVCTGAFVLRVAGLLKGRRATTHWASFHLLRYFGAIPVNERVVVDGNWLFAAGVTAGIDGALRLAAELRGEEIAQTIQLYMAYAPEPPFNSGTPETAPPTVLERARQSAAGITAKREETARRIATRLGIAVPAVDGD